MIIQAEMTSIEEFFEEVSVSVEAELDRLLSIERAEPSILIEAMRWSTFAGGKRFRPALVFASGCAFGADEVKLIKTAAAVEMLHTYSLIHDDLPSMDDDDLRRGRETCHKKFGEATAILAGDALQALAFKAISSDAMLSAQTRIRLISELAEAAGRMVAGQQMDLEFEDRSVTPAEVGKVHENKTGALITFSVRAGALIAAIGGEPAAGITIFGARLGLLFQISDDILDVTQPTDVLGKTAAKDLSSNKATYPSVFGLENAKKLLVEAYRDTISTLDRIEVPTDRLAQIAEFVANRRS